MTEPPKPMSTRRTLQNVFNDLGDRKLILMHGTSKQQDSRFTVHETAVDHVVIKLLGDDMLVLPFGKITSVRIERQQVYINYG